jgi:hypothetical protein
MCQRFDVTENLKNFAKFLGTKQPLRPRCINCLVVSDFGGWHLSCGPCIDLLVDGDAPMHSGLTSMSGFPESLNGAADCI